MAFPSLPRHGALAAASRAGGAAGRLAVLPAAGAMVLALLGASAAWLTFHADLGVRVPGHAILRGALPVALGFALVPRAFAGCAMGAAALAAVIIEGTARGAPGWGSATGLVLLGPCLDAAVARARSGRGIYAALVAGGVAANLAAFAVRLGAKVLLHDGGRPLSSWWPEAILTYALCGAAAGAASAALCFRFSRR